MADLPVLEWTVVERPGPQRRTLVLLHGYGESPDQLTDRLHLLDPAGVFRVVVPAAPFRRRGRAIWHRALTAREDAEEQYLVSLAAVDALLGRLEVELGLRAADAVVGGFSQGGGLAIGLLLGADVAHRPAAAFGVCSFPPVVQGFRVDQAATAGRRYFLSSAREDHFAPIESSRAGAALLRDTGLDVTYREVDGAHEMTDEAARAVGEWLAAVDAGRPQPSDAVLDQTRGRHEFYEDLWEVVS